MLKRSTLGTSDSSPQTWSQAGGPYRYVNSGYNWDVTPRPAFVTIDIVMSFLTARTYLFISTATMSPINLSDVSVHVRRVIVE